MQCDLLSCTGMQRAGRRSLTLTTTLRPFLCRAALEGPAEQLARKTCKRLRKKSAVFNAGKTAAGRQAVVAANALWNRIKVIRSKYACVRSTG